MSQGAVFPLWVLLVVALICCFGAAAANSKSDDKLVVVVGRGDCADCSERKIENAYAVSGTTSSFMY